MFSGHRLIVQLNPVCAISTDRGVTSDRKKRDPVLPAVKRNDLRHRGAGTTSFARVGLKYRLDDMPGHEPCGMDRVAGVEDERGHAGAFHTQRERRLPVHRIRQQLGPASSRSHQPGRHFTHGRCHINDERHVTPRLCHVVRISDSGHSELHNTSPLRTRYTKMRAPVPACTMLPRSVTAFSRFSDWGKQICS